MTRDDRHYAACAASDARAEHIAHLRAAAAVVGCERCGAEGFVPTGYEDGMRPCPDCHETGEVPVSDEARGSSALTAFGLLDASEVERDASEDEAAGRHGLRRVWRGEAA